MSGHKLGTIAGSFGAIALALTFAISPAFCAGAPDKSDGAGPAKVEKTSAIIAEPAAEASSGKKTVRQRVKAALEKINPGRLLRDREYKMASVLFPDFCKDWEHKLHEREVNNESHLNLQMKDGWETGSYVGYGPVNKCECHQSRDGYSIGKLTYDEFVYYVTGKSADEAKHAKPKVTQTTSTTELFRWDKGKWFY